MFYNAPMGADDDTRCPWRGRDPEPIYTECPECSGTGFYYFAYDYIAHTEREVSKDEYEKLPISQFEAKTMGKNEVKGEYYTCDYCLGKGLIESYEEDVENDLYDDAYGEYY